MSALPKLREELVPSRTGTDAGGAPVWIVHDPVTGQFLRLSYEAYQILSVWNRARSREEIAALVGREYGREPGADEIAAVAETGRRARLFLPSGEADWRALHKAASGGHSRLMALAHNYVFFQVPLFRPDRLNARIWPLARLFFTRGFALLTMMAGLAGLYLVSRQWQDFVSAFPHVFTLEGALTAFAAVVFVKALHEMGHSLMAHKYGCRTRTIGIAFMLFAPMPYADVTDSWRLGNRRQRMMIDLAGILAELALAAWCLLLWPFLPEGPLRSAVHAMATVSLAVSLFINLNPMARFDGYYILADALDMPNLQERAFAHLRHLLRTLLFGPISPPPERFSPARSALVAGIAVATMAYRLVLYLGIALAVYHFVVKAVGVVMFAFEIVYFLLLPIWRELKVWHGMRDRIIERKQTWVSLAVVAGLSSLIVIPFGRTVTVPVQLESHGLQRVFAPVPARIVAIRVKAGDRVRPGDLLFRLEAPAHAAEKAVALARLKAAETRLARIAAVAEDLSERTVLVEEARRLRREIEGLSTLESTLEIRAQIAGRVTDLPPGLTEGQWISPRDPLALVVGGEGALARGYVRARDLHLVAEGASARFVPDDLSAPRLPFTVHELGATAAAAIELEGLTSRAGGRIAVREDADRKLVPVEAQFPLDAVAQAAAPLSQQRGVLVIKGRPESLLAAVVKQILIVLARESLV